MASLTFQHLVARVGQGALLHDCVVALRIHLQALDRVIFYLNTGLLALYDHILGFKFSLEACNLGVFNLVLHIVDLD